MQRRQFIQNATFLSVGVASGLVSSVAKAADAPNKAKPNALLIQSPAALKGLVQFAGIAGGCAFKGELCVQHCEEQIAAGSTEFANCLTASNQMIIVCGAVSKLAAFKSIRTREILDSCAAACKACKDACDEHKAHWAHGMHLPCKDCSEQCDRLLAEIAKMKAALA